MLSALAKVLGQPFCGLLLACGVLFVLFSQYTFDDWKPLHSSLNPVFLIVGVGCLLAAVITYLLDIDMFALNGRPKVEDIANGFEATFRQKKVSVSFGRFENLATDEKAVVVLPCGEFFDSSCFSDRATVAGAFLHQHFSNDEINAIEAMRNDVLKTLPSSIVPTKSGLRTSYQVGTCVYLKPSFGKVAGIVFAAATSEREGARADLAALFKVLDEVRCIVANNRVPRVYLPLLGAGRGGLVPELSYLLILAGLLQAKASAEGGSIGDIGIIIYQPDGQSPEVTRRVAKEGLRRLLTLYRSQR